MLMKAALILTCINSFSWAKRGTKVFDEVSGKRYPLERFVATKCGSETLASFGFKGTCYTDLFNLWIETCSVPVLKPGQMVILDNATFHKSEKTKTLIDLYGFYLFVKFQCS